MVALFIVAVSAVVALAMIVVEQKLGLLSEQRRERERDGGAVEGRRCFGRPTKEGARDEHPNRESAYEPHHRCGELAAKTQTNSIRAIGALSPERGSSLMMRV